MRLTFSSGVVFFARTFFMCGWLAIFVYPYNPVFSKTYEKKYLFNRDDPWMAFDFEPLCGTGHSSDYRELGTIRLPSKDVLPSRLLIAFKILLFVHLPLIIGGDVASRFVFKDREFELAHVPN